MKVTKTMTLLAMAMAFSGEAVRAGTITMKNGDRITGDIKKIWDGEVFIEPAYADEFSVEQSEVAAIEDDRPFDIEYADGTEVVASLLGADSDGNQIVVIDGEAVAMPLSQLSELEEPDEFYDWATHFDVASALNTGNTDSRNIKFSGDLLYKRGKQRHFFDFLFNSEEQDGITTKDRDFYQYNFNYELSKPWFFGALASFERDPIKGLDQRYNLLPAIGYEIWDDANKLFTLQVGTGYQREKTATLNDAGAVYAAFLRFRYDFADPDLSLYVNNTTTKSSFGRKNAVTQFTTGFRYEITDLLYANVEFDLDYESEPEPGAENEDIALLFGIGVEFDK